MQPERKMMEKQGIKVLVSGGNGFLAGHVITKLYASGYKVRAMMRETATAPALKNTKVEIFKGCITEPADLQKAVKGCTHVIHIAADTSQSHLRLSDYLHVNVNATMDLLECAIREGCRRFIFISSANTIGYGSIDKPGTERNKPSPLFLKSGYATSKILAEDLILQDKYLNKIDIITLNPSLMIGPEDYNPHSGKIFSLIINKKLVFYPPGGKNFIDVRDVADAVIAALEKGLTGERYLLTGTNISYQYFFRSVMSYTGQKSYLLPIPKPFLLLVGLVGSLIRRIGIKTSLSFTNSRILCINNYYKSHKATEFLGFQIRNLGESIAESVDWRRNHDRMFI
ncbi:MAG: NAD-dependent epimerase/dehydratase family protein [Bacteroidales bacterium]